MTTTYPDVQLLIANEWVDATGGKTQPVINPATDDSIDMSANENDAELGDPAGWNEAERPV